MQTFEKIQRINRMKPTGKYDNSLQAQQPTIAAQLSVVVLVGEANKV
ncbi:hypothetical protein LXM25_25965 [Dyadobacter sp. LJ53]|nr:hypothetical protein [Dyadobacter chenwenxiniae]MCF0053545.1 hypothetical protein [Dyadobacter chenwenxiniae]